MTDADPGRPTSGDVGSVSDEASVPPWVLAAIRAASIRAIWVLIIASIGTLAIITLAGRLRGFLGIIFMALFLSFAIEPGVNWFAARGWRRGWATGLIFAFIGVAGVVLLALIIPAIVSGTKQLVQNAPELVRKFADWANKIGINVSATKLQTEIRNNGDKLISSASNFAGNIFGIAASILGGVFRWATIALFTFYFVAQGPQLRRVVCSALPRKHQEQVLFVWDQAIEKTGGYFYSRLLLAVINGTGMYITLRAFKVPFAAPLALFEGVVAEFIPIIGTYIAGAAPVLVAVLTSLSAGIGALAYVLVYQQVENYFLSPRLTAKTMSLNPAMAFAAALIGGALGGILAAFLALPVAGVIQASVSEYGKRYEVVESDLTSETPPPAEPKPPKASLLDRIRRSSKTNDGS